MFEKKYTKGQRITYIKKRLKQFEDGSKLYCSKNYIKILKRELKKLEGG